MESNDGFAALELSRELLQVVSELGFKNMTPIQAQAIPVLLQGKDLVGQSKTGSGKTLAYALPLIESINFETNYIQALVLCPTRELCDQVAREIRKLGRRHPKLKVVSLVGGQPIYGQLNSLRSGAQVAVGTPGRVLDHLSRKSLDLHDAKFIVLDEADRMLDMGFQEDMEAILGSTSVDRQTIFFSATFPDSIQSMSERYQQNPVQIVVEDLEKKAAIEQIALEVVREDKFSALQSALQEYKPTSTIVFCNLKLTVMELADALHSAGVSCACLHGDLEQSERDRVMAKFRNFSVRVLIATDVAARGIDIADLDLVVNFDLPKPDIYVHRIGRTGRAGKTGVALSFMEPREQYKIAAIEDETGQKLEHKRATEFSVAAEPVAAEAKMATLFISGGRKEKMRPGDILGALTGEAGGLEGKDVGKIEIHDHFSYVAVTREVAAIALTRLQNGRIKGRKFRVEMVR